MMEQGAANKFKMVLSGDSGVGKIELMNSLVYSKGTKRPGNTITTFMEKTVQIDKTSIQLQIWKMPGNERFMPLFDFYKRGASGAMVIYDITDRYSFENVHKWCQTLTREDVVIMIIGNKCDMAERREVQKYEGEKIASELGLRFFETSAVNGTNVEEAFTLLCKDMLMRKEIQNFFSSSDIKLRPLQDAATKQTASISETTFYHILRYGVEENYHIRVMFVGDEGVGKSTLVSRLLRKPVNIRRYNSTNGVDVHIHSCDVDIETGTWCFDETREGAFSRVASLWRVLRSANKTTSRDETAGESSSFHMRVAKIIHNQQKLEGMKYGRDPVLTKLVKENQDSAIRIDTVNTAAAEERLQSNLDATRVETEVGEKSENDSVDDSSFSPAYPFIDNADIEKVLMQTKSLDAEKMKPKARVDFYDFAGQVVFQASHPTFLTSMAIFVLMFDMNKQFKEQNAKSNVDKMQTNDWTEDKLYNSLFYWLNIAYMYKIPKGSIYPHVVLVGTHADQLPKENRHEIIEKCFRDIRCLLANSPLKSILSDKEFAVDNTKKTDPCFSQLQSEIFHLAQIQPHWGEKTPLQWLPLEREIYYAKESGLKVLSISQIEELNSRLQVNISENTELQLFLQFLHDSGEILFFNEPSLRDYVVLDPILLIDALKAIITADQFAIRSPKQADKWKHFCDTGIIKQSTIIAIFKESKDDPALFENYNHVLRLLEKFLFIVSPKYQNDANEHSEEKDGEYIVPSMVKKEMDSKIIISSEGLSSTTVLCMVSKNNFLPSAVFHKLLAKCISEWQIMEQNGRAQIFSHVCKFNLDRSRHYKLTVFYVKHAIHARIVSYTDITRPCPAICKPVYEFLVDSLRRILTGMGFSEEFRTCIQCPKFSPISCGGYLDLHLMVNEEFTTCDECQCSHVMQTVDLLSSWMDKGSVIHEDSKEILKPASINQIQKLKNVTKPDEYTIPETLGDRDKGIFGPGQPLLDVPITQEHLNHARVCNALVTVCADGLRDILLSQIPPHYSDFYQLLLARKPALTVLKQFRPDQINIMFPDSKGRFTGTVDQFDITLLYALVRNISSVPAPVTGWGKAPVDNPRDTSLGANAERIRICRNCVSGHSMDGRLDDQAFENYWKEICLIMTDIEQSLGVRGYQDALKKRKDQILSPAEAQLLKSTFLSFQAEVISAVETVTEKMRILQAMMEGQLDG